MSVLERYLTNQVHCQDCDRRKAFREYELLVARMVKAETERDRLKAELAEVKRNYETGMECMNRAHGMAIDREYTERERAEKAEAERDRLREAAQCAINLLDGIAHPDHGTTETAFALRKALEGKDDE